MLCTPHHSESKAKTRAPVWTTTPAGATLFDLAKNKDHDDTRHNSRK